ncbi:MAG TPA: hypothetical protein VKB78_02760, partial [Pirellulales bacterium]|nr:hypothetical protein [Pirellulales bacterium]
GRVRLLTEQTAGNPPNHRPVLFDDLRPVHRLGTRGKRFNRFICPPTILSPELDGLLQRVADILGNGP